MIRSMQLLLSLLTLVAFSGQALGSEALADCELPATPIVPDGNVASEDELVSAQGAMKLYQSNLTEFRLCLSKKQEVLDPQAEETATINAEIGARYDVSFEAETAIAEEFNLAVRAYKARQ